MRASISCFLFLSIITVIQAGSVEINQKIRIQAFGTGRTTGHVANLIVRNKNRTALQILPQRVFIPSTGAFQPYLADIPATTIAPGRTDTIHLTGYCTDEHLRASPSDQELIAIEKWIPIRSTDTTTTKEGVLLVSRNSVVPFLKDHITYIITALAYRPLYPPPDSMRIVVWPGTDIPVGGTLNHLLRPDLYATVMSRVVMLLEKGIDSIQSQHDYSTPFVVNTAIEREALMQQMIWIYASALAGKKYNKENFAEKVYEQFKTSDSLQTIPALEKQELDEGIDEFWNMFLRISRETQLFNVKSELTPHGMLVDVPIDTIQYPWSVVSLTNIIMKPAYVKIVPVKPGSPVVPILAGATSLGSLAYIAFHKQGPNDDCTVNASLEAFPSACHLDNGSVVVTTDNDANYSFAWSNGDTTRDVLMLPAGIYTVTITRVGETCTKTLQAEVINVDPIITTDFVIQHAYCGGQNGSITPSVNPPGFYTYEWSNGSIEQIQDSLAAGIYTLIVHASGTCVDSNMITVQDIPPAFNIDITTTPTHCNENDGTATAVVTPEGNYTYQWSNGSTSSGVIDLQPGEYSLTVTESATTCQVVSNVTIESLQQDFTVAFTSTDASCGLNNGTATANVEPAGEYQYTWSNGQTGNQITDLAPGTYTLTVTKTISLCSDTAQIVINQLPPDFTISTSVLQHATCGLNNGAVVALPDPAGEYVYLWSNGQTTEQASNLAPGQYIVTVTKTGTSCQQTLAVTIDSLPAHYIDIVSTSPGNCTGGGEIVFMLTSPVGSTLHADIIGPPKTFFISLELNPGTYSLSSFESIQGGPYIFIVYDLALGPACMDTIIVGVIDTTLNLEALEDIYTTQVDQPVSGNVIQNDTGFILMLISVDSIVGGSVSFTPDGSFTFTPEAGFNGLGYFIYGVMDGCGDTTYANVMITVQPLVPPDDDEEYKFSFGSSISNFPIEDPEHSSTGDESIWISGLQATLEYPIHGLNQQTHFGLYSGYGPLHENNISILQVEQLLEIGKLKCKFFSVSMHGGIGLTSFLSNGFPLSPYYTLNMEAKMNIGKRLSGFSALHVRGWQRIEGSRVSIGISIPFISKSLKST